MIYLLFAILSSAAITLVMRWSGKHTKSAMGMLGVNYLMCTLLAALHTGFDRLIPAGVPLGGTLAMGLFNGFLFLAGFVLLQVSIRKNGVVLSSIFMKLGLLVPMVVSVAFFGEKPTVVQILGFLLAVGAIVLINYEKDTSAKGSRTGLLLLLLLAGGGGDTMSKVFEELGPEGLSAQFLFYTFVVATLLCLGLMAWKKQPIGKAELLWGLALGVPNFYAARFLLRALGSVPAVIAYPTYSVGTILAVTLAGVLLFQERLSRRHWVAFVGILAALALLNI